MTLQSQLDRSFIQAIERLHGEMDESSKKPVFDREAIMKNALAANPSLRRKNLKMLKASMENAIDQMKQNESSSDDMAVQLVEVADENAMNRSLVGMYQKSNEEKPIKRKLKESKRSEAKKTKGSLYGKYPTPPNKLSDMGGVNALTEELLGLVGMPMTHPEIYSHLGIEPPRGILLHGPPGCGKTMLASCIAGELQVPFINIAAPAVVSGMSGESEQKIRDVFEEALQLAPCIVFIDEIDAITTKRENAQREMEKRIVAQLLTSMDGLATDKTGNGPVIVIGATNRPDSIDPALRRAGRFDRELCLGIPDVAARTSILTKLSERLTLDGSLDVAQLARLTPGYVGADLKALTAEAGAICVKRILEGLSNDSMVVDSDCGPMTRLMRLRPSPLSDDELKALCISFQDFLQALKKVQPSAKREGFATVPDVTWEDIGALQSVREELSMAIVQPIVHADLFKQVGITRSMGVLLYGPPGCGKTLLAKAVASESHCNFIAVKGPELLNKYVGESERSVRTVFARAQASSPCVIFFDELDALCPSRSAEAESQSASRLVNTFLTEMDGMQGRNQVFVIAATNRPDMIDPAMLRPGRLDKALYVDLPSCEERYEIIKTLARKTPLSDDVDLKAVASNPKCDGMSGADLASLVREAAISALRSKVYVNGCLNPQYTSSDNAVVVNASDFDAAFSHVSPSVRAKDRKRYELLKVRFGTIDRINTTSNKE